MKNQPISMAFCLNDCPECQQHKAAVRSSQWEGRAGKWEALCLACGAHAEFADTMQLAIRAWNELRPKGVNQ